MQVQLLKRALVAHPTRPGIEGYVPVGTYTVSKMNTGVMLWLTPALPIGMLTFETYNRLLNEQSLVVMIHMDEIKITVAPDGLRMYRGETLVETRHA